MIIATLSQFSEIEKIIRNKVRIGTEVIIIR